MSSPARRTACRNCGRTRPPDELDGARWCRECRRRVVSSAAWWARLVAILVTAAVAVWAAVAIQPTRFVVAWLLLIAGTYFITVQIARRVAFEIIRSRGVPPPEEEHGKD